MATFSEFRWIWYGLTVGVTLLVYQTIHGGALVRCRHLASTGERCYGLYLIHFFIATFAFKSIGKGVWVAGTVYVILSFILAAVSFRYFEQPIQRLRIHFHRDARLRVALFATLGLMTLVNVAYLVIKSRL